MKNENVTLFFYLRFLNSQTKTISKHSYIHTVSVLSFRYTVCHSKGQNTLGACSVAEPNIGIRAEGILKTKSQSRRGFQKPGAGAEGDFKSKELEPKGISKARSRSRRGFQKPRARADRSLAGSREHCFW